MTEDPATRPPLPDKQPHRRRRWYWTIGLGFAAMGGFVAVWFQPQKLLINETVNDPPPVASGGGSTDAEESGSEGSDTSDAATPARLKGEFISLDHPTSGNVRVLDEGTGGPIVRLEHLATDNGPDLFLYLSTSPANGPEDGFDDDFVNLGRLKGNRGDQNYDVPADVDIDRYRSVVIWCDRFNSAFGAADLAADTA